MSDSNPAELRFNGSMWCNMDIALRVIDRHFKQLIRPAGLKVVEWYVLQALYEQNGQHASQLADAIGRAATSFTPNLDKLERKGLIERQQDDTDRRAVRIYLTEVALSIQAEVEESADEIDAQFRKIFDEDEYRTFQRVLAVLQTLPPPQSA